MERPHFSSKVNTTGKPCKKSCALRARIESGLREGDRGGPEFGHVKVSEHRGQSRHGFNRARGGSFLKRKSPAFTWRGSVYRLAWSSSRESRPQCNRSVGPVQVRPCFHRWKRCRRYNNATTPPAEM